MTIEQAIRKSIKQGYNRNYKISDLGELSFIEQVVCMDPLFWKALGKAMGWNKGMVIEYHWHCMIDHLVNGGTIKEFFETL